MKHLVLTLLLTLVALMAIPLQADPDNTTGKGLLRLESSVDAMGSVYTMALYGTDQDRLKVAAEEAAEEVQRLDRMLSNYIPTSDLSQINRDAGNGPVRVAPELFDLLTECMKYSRASEGAFDVTVGPLMKVWGFYKGTGRLPHRAEILGALSRVGYQKIQLDPSNHSVQFARDGMNIDLGGIGKGYAVDRMVDIIRKDGIRVGLISAAGSSIYAMGAPPTEPRGWKVSIKNPKKPSTTIQDVYLKDQSMSTSGNYEKFFYAEGRMWSHIMDPRTGYPAEGILSVSVIAPKTIDSEAWTKPFYINGRQWAANHKPKGFRVFVCEDKKETSCAWLQ
jgi:thiamine biosynthesis lipoprotein